jgi:hypothetical protein
MRSGRGARRELGRQVRVARGHGSLIRARDTCMGAPARPPRKIPPKDEHVCPWTLDSDPLVDIWDAHFSMDVTAWSPVTITAQGLPTLNAESRHTTTTATGCHCEFLDGYRLMRHTIGESICTYIGVGANNASSKSNNRAERSIRVPDPTYVCHCITCLGTGASRSASTPNMWKVLRTS